MNESNGSFYSRRRFILIAYKTHVKIHGNPYVELKIIFEEKAHKRPIEPVYTVYRILHHHGKARGLTVSHKFLQLYSLCDQQQSSVGKCLHMAWLGLP